MDNRFITAANFGERFRPALPAPRLTAAQVAQVAQAEATSRQHCQRVGLLKSSMQVCSAGVRSYLCWIKWMLRISLLLMLLKTAPFTVQFDDGSCCWGSVESCFMQTRASSDASRYCMTQSSRDLRAPSSIKANRAPGRTWHKATP